MQTKLQRPITVSHNIYNADAVMTGRDTIMIAVMAASNQGA